MEKEDIKQTEKYVVYENDLKFKKMQNIDPEKADWYDESVKELFNNTDFDTVKARLKACKEANFTYLDFSRLELKKIPKLTKYVHFDKLNQIKYLFLNDNEIEECDERLSYFTNLEVLDISYNKIKTISYLPNTLNELVCHHNKLVYIPPHQNIKILDCTNNKLENLNQYPNLKDLVCINNNLSNLITYPQVKRIICKQNKITYIDIQPMLELLDCSENNLEKLQIFDKLKGLICNFTNISYVDSTFLPNLESLEIVGCKMKVSYIKTLKCLLCEDSKDTITLSSKFKIKHAIAEGKSLCCIFDVATNDT